MHAHGYLDQASSRRPLPLIGVAAAHAAVVAALVLMPPEFVRDPVKRMIGYNVALPEPPPPSDIEQVKLPKTPATTATAEPRPDLVTKPDPVLVIDLGSGPVIGVDSNTGAVTVSGGGEAEVPARPLPPVLTEASLDPRYAADLQPPYPPSLERSGIEGNVTLRIRIGQNGRVIGVEVVRADQPEFAEAARRQALRKWRFRPATRDGEAVESWKTMTLRFVLAG